MIHIDRKGKRILLFSILLLVLISMHNTYSFPGWAKYDISNSPLKRCYSLAIDDHGVKWISDRYTIYSFDGKAWTQYTDKVLPGTCINVITVGRNNTVWAGFGCPPDDSITNEGLFRFVDSKWEKVTVGNSGYVRESNAVYSMANDRKGNLWIAAVSQLVCYNGVNWLTLPEKVSLWGSNPLVVDKNNNKWIGTGNTKARFYNDTIWDSVAIGGGQGIGGMVLAVDSTNAVWFSAQGVWKRTSGQWVFFDSTKTQLLSAAITVAGVDKMNRKWIGSKIGRIALYNDTTWHLFDSTNSPLQANDRITAIAFDGDGSAWIGSSTGLYHYENPSSLIKNGVKKSILSEPGCKTGLLNSSGGKFFFTVSSHNTQSNITIDFFTIDGCKLKTIKAQYNSQGEHIIGWDGRSDSGKDIRGSKIVYRITQ